jgi:hypothetical protein
MSNYRGDAGWGFNMIQMNIIHVYSCHSSKISWIFQIFKPSSNNIQTIFKQSSNNLQTIFKPTSNHLQTIFKPSSNVWSEISWGEACFALILRIASMSQAVRKAVDSSGCADCSTEDDGFIGSEYSSMEDYSLHRLWSSMS